MKIFQRIIINLFQFITNLIFLAGNLIFLLFNLRICFIVNISTFSNVCDLIALEMKYLLCFAKKVLTNESLEFRGHGRERGTFLYVRALWIWKTSSSWRGSKWMYKKCVTWTNRKLWNTFQFHGLYIFGPNLVVPDAFQNDVDDLSPYKNSAVPVR